MTIIRNLVYYCVATLRSHFFENIYLYDYVITFERFVNLPTDRHWNNEENIKSNCIERLVDMISQYILANYSLKPINKLILQPRRN